MRYSRGVLVAGVVGALACVASAQGPPVVKRLAQPRVDSQLIASSRTTLIVPENSFGGFADGEVNEITVELADGDGNRIAGTKVEVSAGTSVNSQPIGSGGVFTPMGDLVTVRLDIVGVIGTLLNITPSARYLRLHIVDSASNRATVDFRIDERRPMLIDARLDTTPGAERIDLVFDADLTNRDGSNLREIGAQATSRTLESADTRPIVTDGPDNEVNQTTQADLDSLDDFELATDADFTTPIVLDGTLVSFARILDDRRTIRYDIEVPAAFSEGLFVRPGISADITSVTGVRADGVAMITNASRSVSCPADRNADGMIDGADLGLLLGAWGAPDADLNGDGTTDGADLGLLLTAWGRCP